MSQTPLFEEQFYSLCEMLGENISTLNSQFGRATDISANEDRAFICYPDSHAVFRVKNNLVDHLTIPKADAYGHDYDGPKDFYSFDGVRLGMTKEEIIEQWGEPAGRKYFCYENKKTKSGKTITIGFGFKEGANNESYLSEFSARPYVAPAFEEIFKELCELLGCNEETIIDNIGKPDASETNEYGTKFIYYERYKANFTISSDLHTACYVSSPYSRIESATSTTTDNYYTLFGIKIGDPRSLILQKWGKPTSQATYSWSYGNKAGHTKSRNQYELRLSFRNSDPDNLAEFEGGLKEESEPHIPSPVEKPKSGCFIATACYGDYEASEVLVLRGYRDNVLLKSNIGKIAVNIYYFISPSLAQIIRKSDWSKQFIRKNILNPIILSITQNNNK